MAKMITLSGFASPVSPKALKDFLEEHTGEGTVSKVEVGQNKGLKAHAVVEFTTVEAADLIMSFAGNSYLKASYVKRTPHCKLGDDLKLNFGCQISKDKFSVFWSQENVSVKLCSDLRKFEFFLSYESVDSRFELSDESISQIELHVPSGHSVKYLVIQLHGPPMIYKNDIHWVREVDFTPSSSVGKSSAICLELPSRAHIPKALKDLFYYKESPVQFTLVPCSVFSCNSDLVPMTYGKKNDKEGKGKGKASLNQVHKDGVKCFFCRKKGHMKKACPKYRTWLEKKKGNPISLVCYESSMVQASQNTWRIDSSSTIHVANTIQGIDSSSTIHVANTIQGFLNQSKPMNCKHAIHSRNKEPSDKEVVGPIDMSLILALS